MTDEEVKKGLVLALSKFSLALVPILGTLYVFHAPHYFGAIIYKEQYHSFILMLLLVSAFLTLPLKKGTPKRKYLWLDMLLVVLSLITAGYVALFFPKIAPTVGYIMIHRVIFGGILIVLLLEAIRRLLGWTLVILGGFFVLYAAYAWLLPGMFHSRKIPWGRVLSFLYLSPEALLGVPLEVAATIVFSFIFFGNLLFATGGGKFLSDLALALVGTYRGGPAKVAILASALFGSLSGSASANVAMTGVITIPLMKRIGYKPHLAAAIEAVASTGGNIMPPIMAATAFIMAEFLEMPYARIALAALVPSLLYYIAVFSQVHLEAMKGGFKGLSREEVPTLKEVLKSGWIYFIPGAVLIFCLFVFYMSPSASALYGVGATAVVSLFKKETRSVITKKGWTILQDVGRGVMEVGLICTLAGVVIGAISLTGFGVSLSDALVIAAGGNVLLLLVFSAIGAIVLGMGMPLTATYIMLVVLIAPALIQMGVEPLAAHLFVMYFGVMSFLTPPVAIAAYVASGIARSDPMRTCLSGVRLGIVAYIVPFVFAVSPSLILIGTPGRIFATISTALAGTVLLTISLTGYLFGIISMLKRIWLAVGALLLISPSDIGFVVGVILTAPLLFWEWKKRSSKENLKLPVSLRLGHKLHD